MMAPSLTIKVPLRESRPIWNRQTPIGSRATHSSELTSRVTGRVPTSTVSAPTILAADLPRREVSRAPATRSRGDAEQQADHQVSPEQSTELLGEFGRTPIEKSRRVSSSHDLTEGSAKRLAPQRVECLRNLGRMNRLGDRESEYRDDCRIGY